MPVVRAELRHRLETAPPTARRSQSMRRWAVLRLRMKIFRSRVGASFCVHLLSGRPKRGWSFRGVVQFPTHLCRTVLEFHLEHLYLRGLCLLTEIAFPAAKVRRP